MLQEVVCITKRNAVPRQMNIKIGNTYYLDILTVVGDLDGDWYGNIYEDDKKQIYIGYLNLNHFKSKI